jgi:methyl-accepting chemotaxis protein
MKIFAKIFLSIFCFVIVIVTALSLIMVRNQAVYVEQEIIKQVKIIGDFLTTQIEIGFIQSQLPYESLSKLTKSENFLFWWIVKDDGTIYRANDPSFMGTVASEYFPDAVSSVSNNPVYLDNGKNFGIYVTNLAFGSNNWKFWYGFSTKSIDKVQKNILLNSFLVIVLSLGILGISLYFLVSFFVKPIKSLSEGVSQVSKGNLDYVVNVLSRDEIGDLAIAFGRMTEDLKKGKKTQEDYNKQLEQQVAERTVVILQKVDELEKMNKLMVDRELKMVELKKRISELEKTNGTPA